MKKILLLLVSMIAIGLGGCPDPPVQDPRPPLTEDQKPVLDPTRQVQDAPPG